MLRALGKVRWILACVADGFLRKDCERKKLRREKLRSGRGKPVCWVSIDFLLSLVLRWSYTLEITFLS